MLEKLRFVIHESGKRSGETRGSSAGVQYFDKSDLGEISRRDFKRGLEELKFDLSRDEIRVVMDRFDRDGDGFIQYSEFCDFVNGESANEPVVRAVRGNVDSYAKSLGAELVGVLKAQASDIAASSTTLRAAFRPLYEIDRNRTGNLEPADFERALYECGFNLRPRFVRSLVQCFDFTRDASVEYVEFVEFVGSLIEVGSARARREVDDIGDDLKRIVQKAKERGVDYKASFEHFDADYSGEIDAHEFFEGLKTLGIEVEKAQSRSLMKRFGGRKGRIDYRSFLQFVAPQSDAEVEAVAEKLRKMIHKRAKTSRGLDFSRPFKHFERDDDDSITRSAFKRGLEALGIDELTDSEVRTLIDKFDDDRDGRISYREFRDFAEGADAAASPKTPSRQKPRFADKSSSLLSRMRKVVNRAEREYGLNARSVFESMDENFDGLISVDEFKRGLKNMKIRASEKDWTLSQSSTRMATERLTFASFC